MEHKNRLIEEALYLASLASNARDVDPMLDTLRIITSQQGVGAAGEVSEEDAKRLQGLREQLVTYLTTKDPVRTFKRESLEKRVEDHFTAHSPRAARGRHILIQVIGIVVISLLAYGLAFALLRGTSTVRSTLAAPAFMLSINIGLAWLFWSARHELVPQLQKAYSYLAAGILTSAVISIQYPIFTAYPNLTHHSIFQNGGFMLAYPLMYFLFYWAYYLFARQLPDVKDRYFTLRNVVVGGAILALIMAVVPHTSVVTSELYYRLALISVSLGVYLSVMGAILAFIVAKHVTVRYRLPLTLLGAAQVVFALTSSAIVVVLYVQGQVSPLDTKMTAISTPFIISLLCQLAAGYLFKRSLQE